MLVLSRRPSEDVILITSDGPVRIRLIEVRSANMVRLGFEAPAAVRIYRDEVLPPEFQPLPAPAPVPA